MSEQSFIKMDYFINGNAPAGNQAKFLAQQHFNNNGMGNYVVVSAEFTDGGINVVYSVPPIDTEDEIDLTEPKKRKPGRPKKSKKDANK